MAVIQEQDIQKLLEQVETLCKKLESVGDPGRSMLRTVEPGLRGIQQELGIATGGKLASGVWDRLPDDLKASLHERLVGAEQVLCRATGADSDGPSDPKSIMYKDFASNAWIVGLSVGAILGTVIVIWGIYRYWEGAVGGKPSEAEVLRMILLMGALGGLLHWTSSFAIFVGNRQFRRCWIIYYLLMPFEGAGLALLVYLLLRVGVLAPNPAGNGIANLNLTSLYAFAGLTGLFAKQAIEMLADVFSTIFKKIRAKDALDADKGKQESIVKASSTAGGGQIP